MQGERQTADRSTSEECLPVPVLYCVLGTALLSLDDGGNKVQSHSGCTQGVAPLITVVSGMKVIGIVNISSLS